MLTPWAHKPTPFYKDYQLARANYFLGGMEMISTLDRLLVNHCGATLVGVKAACLVSCCRVPREQVADSVAAYNRALNRSGLLFRIYHNRAGCPLLFVYRPALLWNRLRSSEAAPILAQAGYSIGLKDCLDRLGDRLAAGEEFPHEIGLFLDYPPDDVAGYLLHGGRDCKACGYWKVYSDVDRANRLFRLYDACREALCAQLDKGLALVELLATQPAPALS